MEASTSINAPHPDADPDEEAKFFAGAEDDEDGATVVPAVKDETEPDTEPDPANFNPESGTFEEPEAAAEEPTPEHAQTADPTDAPSTSPAEGANGAAASASPASSGTTAEAAEGKKRGSIDREYIVFQKVPLTKAALAHLLKVLEAGDEGKVRIAYMEVDRLQARNAVQAVGVTFLANQATLGEKGTTLAAVSSKSFQEKTVKPKQNIETTLDIS